MHGASDFRAILCSTFEDYGHTHAHIHLPAWCLPPICALSMLVATVCLCCCVQMDVYVLPLRGPGLAQQPPWYSFVLHVPCAPGVWLLDLPPAAALDKSVCTGFLLRTSRQSSAMLKACTSSMQNSSRHCKPGRPLSCRCHIPLYGVSLWLRLANLAQPLGNAGTQATDACTNDGTL